MARTKITPALKRRLIESAGGKCANPGCPNILSEFHHIREWHVCPVHDEAHMIAICPACHEAVSRGTLRVTEEIAYAWKRIVRDDRRNRGSLYVEPSTVAPRLVLGTMTARGSDGLVVFASDQARRLAFRVNELEIMGLEARIANVEGDRLARVVDGHFEATPGTECVVDQRPGRFRIGHPASDEVMPRWVLAQMREHEPTFGDDGSVSLLDMEVLAPNLVRVEGVWVDKSGGLIITKNAISFVRPDLFRPISLVGAGLETVLHYTGPVDQALFGFGAQAQP